ncbi:MAG: DnaJ C-terminal domain-containing protein [Sandaracinaceae bacterium]|mgnify:CR=1 FL=1|nr:MAG: hypothetical protein EVA89_16270 [Sandaracinaceae bacterium]
MSYKDYYQVLGIGRDASAEELQKAYRRLAKKYHPDVSKEPDAEDRFKELGEAYEVLKDPEKRRLYDKWGQHWKAISEGRQPPPGSPGSSEFRFDFGDFDFGGAGGGGGSGGADFRSIFEQVFGGQRQSRPGHRRRPPPRGRPKDHETTLTLSVKAAYDGGPRDIQFVDAMTGEPKRLTVNVPGGVRSGQRIRLSGQAGGGGDLYLVVEIANGDLFRIEGDDVTTPLKVSPSEAVLGGTAPLTTLDGNVRVKIPPGSSTGRRIRLRGRGYPGKGGRRGDLFAEIQVVVPSEPTDEEKKLYAQLAEVSPFDPRD